MSTKVVGTLTFNYGQAPYLYTDALTSQISEYKGLNKIFSSVENVEIGSLYVEVCTQLLENGSNPGQVCHTYNLPEGSFQAAYLQENMTSKGTFQPNSTNYGTVISGSGNFLGAIGSIVATTDATTLRKVKVCFVDTEVYTLPLPK
jgi:hypothetical protein